VAPCLRSGPCLGEVVEDLAIGQFVVEAENETEP
jgi:hypothetical protein